MTKTPSVEERVEEFTETLKGEFPCQMFGGVPHYDILLLTEELKASFTAQRLTLLTELRDSVLLEEKNVEVQSDGEYHFSENQKVEAHNTLARAIKAHLDELINPTNV